MENQQKLKEGLNQLLSNDSDVEEEDDEDSDEEEDSLEDDEDE